MPRPPTPVPCLSFTPHSAHNAYSLSKLCNQIFTLKLARMLTDAGSPVVSASTAARSRRWLLPGFGDLHPCTHVHACL